VTDDEFDQQIAVRRLVVPNRGPDDLYRVLQVDAGARGSRRVVPPAGEAHAFDVALWARRVSVSVSPSGRSVRVFVDGVEIPKIPRGTG
jgi:hypothetical protein